MVKVYKTTSMLLAAVRAGEVPVLAVSPGYAAAKLGVTRQALQGAIERGRLDVWRDKEGSIILIPIDSLSRWEHDPQRAKGRGRAEAARRAARAAA